MEVANDKINGTPRSAQPILPFNLKDIGSWGHIQDLRLYIDNLYAVKRLEQSLDYQEETGFAEPDSSAQTLYHCYWRGPIGRKQVFSIMSFLCTQDLSKCQVILWLDTYNGYDDHEQNALLKPILPYIEVRKYDPLEEVKTTPWFHHKDIPTNEEDLVERADAFRFLILYKYGGVYFDLDIMFLRDISEFTINEFCYAWEIQPYANSALLYLKQKSNLAFYLLKKATLEGVSSPWKIFHYEDPFLTEFTVLPSAFFDPIWQGALTGNYPVSNFKEFFKPFDEFYTNYLNITTYKQFFKGCYAYHWHNQWDEEEEENSFFGIFEKEFHVLLSLI